MSVIRTHFNVTDNSGITRILVVQNLINNNKYPKLGDLVVGVVKKVKDKSSLNVPSIVYAVVIRLKNKTILKQGLSLRFGDNSVVLVDKNLNPISSRIFGVVPRSIKDKGCLKFNSLTTDFI